MTMHTDAHSLAVLGPAGAVHNSASHTKDYDSCLCRLQITDKNNRYRYQSVLLYAAQPEALTSAAINYHDKTNYTDNKGGSQQVYDINKDNLNE